MSVPVREKKERRGWRGVAAGNFREQTARNDWIMTTSLIIAAPLAAAEEVVKYCTTVGHRVT